MISSHSSRRPDQHHDPYYDALCPQCGDEYGDLEEWVDREDRLQVLEDHLDEVTDENKHTVLFKRREW